MAPRTLFPALALLCSTACMLPGGDADEDGVTNGEEETLGTDPENPDSDGDGLNDGDEVSVGSDPLNEDSDGDGLLDGEEADLGSDPTNTDSDEDGYPDGAEVEMGSDPADAESGIYAGGWPYNENKESMDDPGFDGKNKVGKMVPRLIAPDQFGDQFDLYDFGLGGKYTIIDASATWCYYCVEMAKWLEHDPSSYFSDPSFTNTYGPLRDAIDAGELQWLTVLGQNDSGAAPKKKQAENWYNSYPHPLIPVVADKDQELVDWWGIQGWPSFILVDENMEIVNNNGLGGVFDAALGVLEN